MPRQKFTLRDFEMECQLTRDVYRIDTHSAQRRLGLRIDIPAELHQRYPFSASAYALMQELRTAIYEFGILEFPGLPVNRSNHTLAQRDPQEHGYSNNTYMTDACQDPHQDIPPFPSAFWLGAARRYSSTWVLSNVATERYYNYRRENPTETVEAVHRTLVAETLADHTAILHNREAGLLLIDNSDQQQLYHARTRNFDALPGAGESLRDTPMYAYNEPGLLQYIDQLDSRRGSHDRCARDLAEVREFLARPGA